MHRNARTTLLQLDRIEMHRLPHASLKGSWRDAKGMHKHVQNGMQKQVHKVLRKLGQGTHTQLAWLHEPHFLLNQALTQRYNMQSICLHSWVVRKQQQCVSSGQQMSRSPPPCCQTSWLIWYFDVCNHCDKQGAKAFYSLCTCLHVKQMLMVCTSTQATIAVNLNQD